MTLINYPLKFQPIFKETIWGGDKIKTILKKDTSSLKQCGESWEITGFGKEISMITNGFLKGTSLKKAIRKYQSSLLGKKAYEVYGDTFPLLIKFIDAKSDLSIQLHPNDNLALKAHQSFGKTEMWYILQAEKNARIIYGFNQKISKETYLKHLKEKTLLSILNQVPVKKGNVFFLPAGKVHAIGGKILLAEIQQASDITYRIYDWDRVNKNGKKRELHTKLALQAIDFQKSTNKEIDYHPQNTPTTPIVSCPYFNTSLITIENTVERNYENLDSFKILINVENKCVLSLENDKESLNYGEVVLIPASLQKIKLSLEKTTHQKAKLLEITLP